MIRSLLVPLVLGPLVLGLTVSACSSSSSSEDDGGGSDPPGDDAPPSGDGNEPTDGDDGGNGTTDGGVTRIGTVRVGRTSAMFDSITLDAVFSAYSPTLDAFTLPASYVPDTDTCVIFDDSSVPTRTGTVVGLDLTFHFAAGDAIRQQIRDRDRADRSRLISAGDTLVFTAPGGTFGELVRDPGTNGYRMTGGSIVGAAPESLVVDIPGDAFPAFGAVDVPVMSHVIYTDESSNGSSAIVTTSRLSWEPDTTTDSLIALYAQASNLDGPSPLLLANLVCVLVDDGEFELTTAQRQRIHTLLSTEPTRPEHFTAFDFQRVGYRTLRRDDAVLIVQSVVAGEREF